MLVCDTLVLVLLGTANIFRLNQVSLAAPCKNPDVSGRSLLNFKVMYFSLK